MNRTKIEYCDYTWNPIKGLCPEACWYCYARRMYQRFKLDPKLRWAHESLKSYRIPPGSKIFICSTMELFHPQVPKSWRDSIFEEIKKNTHMTFIILTKRPELIDRVMPDNVWLGVSVEGGRPDQGVHRIKELSKHDAKVRFVSIEPFFGSTLGPFEIFEPPMDWYIVGRLTGHGYQNDPTKLSIQLAVGKARNIGAPIFLKNNLKSIWPGPLIQEFPK